MFPCTITIHNHADLSTVMAALAGNALGASALVNKDASGPRTATAGAARGQTAGAPSPTAQSAAAASQASTGGDAGNEQSTAGRSAGQPAAATSASSSTPAASPAVTFDTLKKAFLALSTKPGGRALCEGVLKPFTLGKLSEAKEEQYAQLLVAIEQAAK